MQSKSRDKQRFLMKLTTIILTVVALAVSAVAVFAADAPETITVTSNAFEHEERNNFV